MKCIIFCVLAGIVAIEAKPRPFLGRPRMTDLGNGYGNGMFDLATTGLGMGRLGYGTSGSEYKRGSGFGDSGFSSGASGLNRRGFHSGGGRNFHDIGQHHSSRTSINHAENTDNHNIGGSELFDTGAESGTGFNQFGNGFNRYGNGYESGRQMTSFL